MRGEPVGAPEQARLWLYYKPEGLVTSEADEKGRETVFDNLPEELPRVMSVGRLDLNSEGLLLLTNDGALKRRLELPSTGWLRKYRVRVNGNPMDPDLEPLRRGIVVDGERFQPMSVVIDRIQGANAWLTVGLREGKNREIRRAMAAVGLTVNRLIRVSYGPFRLGDLSPARWKRSRAEVLRDQLGEGRRAARRVARARQASAGRGRNLGRPAAAGKGAAPRRRRGCQARGVRRRVQAPGHAGPVADFGQGHGTGWRRERTASTGPRCNRTRTARPPRQRGDARGRRRHATIAAAPLARAGPAYSRCNAGGFGAEGSCPPIVFRRFHFLCYWP